MAPGDHPSLAIALVTHDSGRWLKGFLESLRAVLAGCPELGSVPIVVADAGSTDDTLDQLYATKPDVQVLRLGNIGYGAAANAALATITARWVLLCNPDLTFAPSFVGTFLRPWSRRPPPRKRIGERPPG